MAVLTLTRRHIGAMLEGPVGARQGSDQDRARAMAIAYGIALQMVWEKPYWAGFAVAFVSLPMVGQSLHKGVLRMLCTLMGGAVALTLIAVFPQERWWTLQKAIDHSRSGSSSRDASRAGWPWRQSRGGVASVA
jgi:hypothetical protein